MSIVFKEDPIILRESDEYTLVAQDESEEFSTIRTITFCSKDETIEIGRFEANKIAGIYSYYEISEDCVGIWTKTGTVEILEKVFDLKNRKFLVGEQNLLMNRFLSSKKSADVPKQKSLGSN